jgi:DNA-binding GntR family transcriptional regulator
MRAGSTDRASLELIHDAAKDAAQRNDAIAYAAVNEDFHRAIYAGGRNETLREMALEVRQRLAPFRSRLFFPRDRVESSLREHEAIVKALLGRDEEKAAEAVRRHTSRTAINVMNHLSTEDERQERPRRAAKSTKRRASKVGRKAT